MALWATENSYGFTWSDESGAWGPMQVRMIAWTQMTERTNLVNPQLNADWKTNPITNFTVGARYFRWVLGIQAPSVGAGAENAYAVYYHGSKWADDEAQAGQERFNNHRAAAAALSHCISGKLRE
jgi:hypothetical protein